MTGEAGDRQVWDEHWKRLERVRGSSLFGTLASFVRRLVLARAVRHYTKRFFPHTGVLVEAGCGTAQASATVDPAQRRLLALDFSLPALLSARRGPAPHRWFVCGDIHGLPFADDAVAGLWNLGVMEHFPAPEGHEILLEFGRVLAPGCCAILFWPPEIGSSRLVLAPIEWLRSRRGRPFRFFPDEVNRLRSRRHGRETLAAAGLEVAAIDATPRDGFIHLVAVGRKPTR